MFAILNILSHVERRNSASNAERVEVVAPAVVLLGLAAVVLLGPAGAVCLYLAVLGCLLSLPPPGPCSSAHREHDPMRPTAHAVETEPRPQKYSVLLLLLLLLYFGPTKTNYDQLSILTLIELLRIIVYA